MRKLLMVVFVLGLMSSCATNHETWTGHKEHKPKPGRHHDRSIDRSHGVKPH